MIEPQRKPEKRLTYKQKAQAGLIAKKPRKAMTRTSPSNAEKDHPSRGYPEWMRKRKETALTKPRTPIRSESKRRAKSNAAYREWIAKALPLETHCQKCKRMGVALDPHHPSGRGRQHLFEVVAVCRACHTHIHEYPRQAMEEGWLQPPIRGLKPDPGHPRPYRLLKFFKHRYEAHVSGMETFDTDSLEEAKKFVRDNLKDEEIKIWSVRDNATEEDVLMSGDLRI
jgi:hypothetical protein